MIMYEIAQHMYKILSVKTIRVHMLPLVFRILVTLLHIIIRLPGNSVWAVPP